MLRALAAGLFVAALAPSQLAASCSELPPDAPIPDIGLRDVASGFDLPVHLATAFDGSGRLYVVEQPGRIRVIDPEQGGIGQLFLDIADRVASGGEMGLLSVAFPADHARSGEFYVNYTTTRYGSRRTVVSRFKRGDGDSADADAETVILEVAQPYGNHNGGQLAFGPDGYLYVGMGDGGSRNDPHDHGQDPRTLLGAILRLDVGGGKTGYDVPADNPFAGASGAKEEVWAWGLRNPWRFSFDAATGTLYAGDVGQNAREEIDIIEGGANYGWRVMEGDICTPGVNDACDESRYTAPLHAYSHEKGRSVTGGHVYRGEAIPELCGVYVFADYVSRRLWGLRVHEGRVAAIREFPRTETSISSFGVDAEGELYAVFHRQGRIARIVAR